MRVSIVGLGKLGASMAAAMASRGCDVTGVDVSASAVERLNSGRAPVEETGLAELISDNHARLRATRSCHAAVLGSEITFVVVPTPSEADGGFSLTHAAAAMREIGRALADKREYHLVVLSSTVLPGSTRFGLMPILEQESGKRCGPDFGLCYSPEFIALGSVIRDFLNPDFTLVGEVDSRAGATLESFYGHILQKPSPCARMSIENAELAKVALNAFVTTKITFANMLADLCERIPGGDVDAVTSALGLDHRVGRAYLRGGSGYGGPCFPRDNVALSYFARSVGGSADLAEVTHALNRGSVERAVDRLREWIEPGSVVAILGLAYKPASHVVEESSGVALALACTRIGVTVMGWDPLARESAKAVLGRAVSLPLTLDECVEAADVLLITTPDPVFRTLPELLSRRQGRAITVVDFWRELAEPLASLPHVRYVPIGRSIDDTAAAERLRDVWMAVVPAQVA